MSDTAPVLISPRKSLISPDPTKTPLTRSLGSNLAQATKLECSLLSLRFSQQIVRFPASVAFAQPMPISDHPHFSSLYLLTIPFFCGCADLPVSQHASIGFEVDARDLPATIRILLKTSFSSLP